METASIDVTAEIPANHSDDLPFHFNKLKKCLHGTMLYNRYDAYVGRSLDFYGEFSEGESLLFNELIKPGDNIIEAGANIGSHTLHMAKTIGAEGHIYAYEPQRIVFQTLCANLALNGITNVHAIQAGLGSQQGHMTVPVINPNQPENFGGISLNLTKQGEPVEIHTIDALKLSHCQLIKVDVEGMELAVIQGAKETIKNLRPILYLENDRLEKSAELVAYVKQLNYQVLLHEPPLFNPANFFNKQENIFGSLVSGNILCIHQDTPLDLAFQHWGLKKI